MAFTVAPTSGTGLFVFSASFLNKGSFFTPYYELRFRATIAEGMCPTNVVGSNSSLAVSALLSDGVYNITPPVVPVGSCRTYRLEVVNTANNTVIDYKDAFIDNIE